MTYSSFTKGFSILFCVSLTGFVSADSMYEKNSHEGVAKVLSTTALYENVIVSVPRRECWTERVRVRSSGQTGATAPLTGAIIGGAIGNQLGGGDGKTALTIGGALLGASIGNDVARQNDAANGQARIVEQKKCATRESSETRKELTGYNVKYQYKGETYNTKLRYKPGSTLRVRVSVLPAD